MKNFIIGFLLILLAISINYGDGGEPDLVVYTSITPNPIAVGHSGKLTITVKEIGGEDWAKDVVVKAYSSNDGIDISPYKSLSKDIDKYGSSTFTFDIDVDKATPIGEKRIILKLDYKETGVMDIGIYSHSKTYTIKFNVIPDYGSLYIKSNPSGADVYIDGYYEGTTPLEIPNLLPDTYILKITKDEYKDYLKEIYISPGSLKTVNAELTPKFGYLTIYTSSGANVYIDGGYVGHPPIRQYKLYEGYHTVKITKDGYNDYSESAYISSGDSKILNAHLDLKSSPSNGNLPSTNSNTNSDSSNTSIIALLFIGLITVVGGGAYFVGRKKKPKTDNSAEVKNTKKENIKPKPTYKPTPKPIKPIPDFPSELLNKYAPLQKLGEGGFGKVFKVKRKGKTQPLAIKTPTLDEKAKKYLLKEIKAWQNLNHPNIVKMYDAYEKPTPHIEMECIEGCNENDLEKLPKPLNPKEAIKLIKQIAEGLKHAHDKNIIHRDIKPSNILLTKNLTPKITDWGLAKIGAKSSTATTTKGLTLLYSAPEQIDDDEYGKTDKRTDIYQLGLLLYELLTGKLPYEGNSPTQISLKIVNPDKKPLPPSKINPNLSIFDGLFEKLLAKKKENRFQSIDEVLDALNSLEELTKEKDELKNALTKTTQKLKTSTNKKEIDKLTRELINSTTKLALNCVKVNDKVGLLDALEILKDYAKSDENRKELEGAIKHIEYLIKESIPLGSDTIDKLNVLINRIKRDWR